MNSTTTQDLQIDETALRAHVIVPSNILNITTEKIDLKQPPAHAIPHGPQVAHLNGAGFCNTLHAALKNSVTGYVMQLQQHGSVIYTLEWNWAQTPSDVATGWNPQVPMHVASLSKMITAISMTKVLDAHNISYDASIAPYLPHYWVKGPNIATVSFRELMTHTSGFTNGGADFLSVKAQVAAGVPLQKHAQYENSNFSILRILLSVIQGDIAVGATYAVPFNDQFWDIITINGYRNYVNANIFPQTGSNGTLAHNAGDALAYNSPATGHGWNSGDLSTVCGAAGWHFSVAQLLKIMGSFRRGNTIMSPAHAQQMLDNMFGIDWKVARPLDGAFTYSKNGLWENGSGQTEQAVAFYLPEDMEMAVFVNSPINAAANFLENVVRDAYNGNIVA
ncbi:serine hydrolase domain-containing protein [Granulicella arctica]|uniref:serine hydrolase domain-containing protein n=1 Tax=Granulicella arctica TaxID=940613 RepID=UPI0021DF82A1|nr:serine hydrolase domain-containing protein [Granulicella arctica]